MSEDELSHRPLTAQETISMQNMLASLKRIGEAAGVPLSCDGRRSDLSALEKILEHLKWSEHGEVPFAAVGLAFGKILAATEPLEWVQVKDQWGEEMSLKLKGFQYFLHPVSMLIKRAEAGEEIDLHYLFEELVRLVRERGPQQMPTPN